MSPNDMPQRKPQHTWTPPVNVQRDQPQTVLAPSTDNARSRRARRNGWDNVRHDASV